MAGQQLVTVIPYIKKRIITSEGELLILKACHGIAEKHG